MIDLNFAPVDELATLPGLTRCAALELELRRPYFSWGEVASVPGFDRTRAEGLRKAGAVLARPLPGREPKPPLELQADPSAGL